MSSYVMITGAAGGLGTEFALDCARRGYDLFLTDLRPEGAELAGYMSQTFGVDARYQACDLTSAEDRTALYSFLKDGGFRFWGLVNNAGLDFEGPFLERSRSQIMTILRLNVESTLDTTYSILKLRDPNRRFMLVNVCSLAAYVPMPYKAVYAATKRFLLDFSLALGEEIRPFGTVTALCPAGLPTRTDTMRAIFAQGFWGKMTTVETRTVARQTIDNALLGRQVFIPGRLNQVIQGIGSLAPRQAAVRLVGSRWKAVQSEKQAWPRLDLSLNK
jgi:short-subunit dehydrogenase